MRPSGIIYQKGKSHKWHSEVYIRLNKKTRALYGFIQGIGAGLIGLSLVSFIFLIFPLAREEIRYNFFTEDLKLKTSVLVEAAETVEKNKDKNQINRETELLGISSEFSIYIPKIDARANVIPSVNPFSSLEYLDALSRGVAHANTTSFPGEGKPVFLFSHSTDSPANFIRYNAVFYLLRKLDIGDEIMIYFSGKRYIYLVESTITVGATDTSWLARQGDEEKLLLMTCDPPGTTFRRLIVIAQKKV